LERLVADLKALCREHYKAEMEDTKHPTLGKTFHLLGGETMSVAEADAVVRCEIESALAEVLEFYEQM
jgi:hypothetical protein